MKNDRLRQSDRSPHQATAAALETAYRLLARRDHTCRELAVKLRQKGHGRDAIDGAMARCRELGYLDDMKTAMTMAGHLVRSGYGPLRVRQALGQKGLDDPVVENALACCGDEDAQVRSAGRVLEKKRSRLAREADLWKRRQKAYRFLAGRGFPPAVINRAIAGV